MTGCTVGCRGLLGIGAGLAFLGAGATRVRAADAEPVKLGMLLDLSSVQVDVSGKSSIVAA